jgi:hypothetical protein
LFLGWINDNIERNFGGFMNQMTPMAAGIASLGRGNDKMLVHMTPGEVQGLQSLAMAHGGSLTINPQTGLPEAGFLENILPTVLGFALTPFLGPMGAGLAIGGLQAARTGDIGKGLMAGLGAYAGAGFGEGLAGLGAGTAEAAGAQNWLAAQNAADAAVASTPGAFPGQIAELGAYNAAPNAPVMGSQYLGDVSAGIGQLSKPGGFSALGTELMGPNAFGGKMGATAAGIGGIGALGGFEQPQLLTPEEQKSNYRKQGPIQRPYDPTAPGGYYFADRGILQPNFLAAKGGEVPSVPQLEDGGFVLTKKAVDGIGGGDNARGQRRAAAGLGAIPIKGPGTGTSDSIRTSIDGVRPAAVSNGESYIPRDQVKRRGGAKKFYALMKKAERAAGKRRS